MAFENAEVTAVTGFPRIERSEFLRLLCAATRVRSHLIARGFRDFTIDGDHLVTLRK